MGSFRGPTHKWSIPLSLTFHHLKPVTCTHLTTNGEPRVETLLCSSSGPQRSPTCLQHHSTIWSTSREPAPLHQSLFRGCQGRHKVKTGRNKPIPFTSTPGKLLTIESCASVVTRWLFRPSDSPRFALRQFPVKQDKRIFQSSEQKYKRPYSSWPLPKNVSGPVCTSGRLATERREGSAVKQGTGDVHWRQRRWAHRAWSESRLQLGCAMGHYFHVHHEVETVTPRTSPTSFRLLQVLSPTPSPLSPWHPTAVGVRHCWSHFAGGETEGLNENLLAWGYKASKRQMQNLPVFPLFCTLHFINHCQLLDPLVPHYGILMTSGLIWNETVFISQRKILRFKEVRATCPFWQDQGHNSHF